MWNDRRNLVLFVDFFLISLYFFENYYRIRDFLKVICIMFWRGFEWEWDSDIDIDLSVVFLGLGFLIFYEVV